MDEQKEQSNEQANQGGQPVPSRSSLYARLSRLAPKAFTELEKLLDSNNESVRLGAINTISDRLIPKLKALELTGEVKDDGTKQPAAIRIILENDKGEQISTGSIDNKQETIQDTNLAPQSTENNNSNLPVDDTGSH